MERRGKRAYPKQPWPRLPRSLNATYEREQSRPSLQDSADSPCKANPKAAGNERMLDRSTANRSQSGINSQTRVKTAARLRDGGSQATRSGRGKREREGGKESAGGHDDCDRGALSRLLHHTRSLFPRGDNFFKSRKIPLTTPQNAIRESHPAQHFHLPLLVGPRLPNAQPNPANI